MIVFKCNSNEAHLTQSVPGFGKTLSNGFLLSNSNLFWENIKHVNNLEKAQQPFYLRIKMKTFLSVPFISNNLGVYTFISYERIN